MLSRKFLNIVVSLMVLTTLVFGGSIKATAAPTAVDETKVPHYFGPNPNWALSPLREARAVVDITGGGGNGATATATVDPVSGAITAITITNPGSGYTSNPNVDITGLGNGAQATAVVDFSGNSVVNQVTVDVAGSGYTAPAVTISGGGSLGTNVTVGNPLISRSFATDYAVAPGVLGPVFVVLQTTMPASGQVTSIQYFNQATNGGSPNPSAGNLFHAYVLHPTGTPNEYSVLWDSGEMTVPTTLDPIGVVETIPVPNIAVTTGDTIAFYGQGIPVDDLGTGADTLSYPAPAAPALGNTITLQSAEYPVLSQTRTYSFGANILDTSAVVPVVDATATAYGGVDAVAIVDGGSGYTFPTVEFGLPDGPGGVQATGHAGMNANGTITAVIVDSAGSGYSAAPVVTIHNGTVEAPDPFLPGGGPASATSTLLIQSVALNTFGSGYASAPTVQINDTTGSGSGAHAFATIGSGFIQNITIDFAGTGYMTPGIKKFVDGLPGLCYPGGALAPAGVPDCPATGKYIPLAVAEAKMYNGVEADEYVIGLVQYRTNFSSSLPDTLVRGYVQLETPANAGISQHYQLFNELLDGTLVDTGYFGVTPPQYLGPIIAATKNKPVRIVFRNLLPTGSDGDLFLPTDSTLMGSGMGPIPMADPMDEGTVMDMVRNPMCSEYPKSADCFKDNRATLHLHGGISPWISDGTAHQWITPAGENTPWPQGVTVSPVPDMAAAGCDGATDGCMTFYYTNQQSARLLFYHDHLWGATRLQVYAGAAAGYLISDDTEKALVDSGTIPGLADTIPLIIQDKTFVPEDWQLYNTYNADGSVKTYGQDPTWDSTRWGTYGDLWYHHVYMPAQNPGDPSGMSAYGRWMYGPWFWPPATPPHGPIANPYYNPNCNLDVPATWQYQTDPFCEPQLIPGTPLISVGMEQFNDTPLVNGVAYPTITLEPKTYRFRVLSAANDRFFNLQWYIADPTTGTDSEVALNPLELAAAQTDPNVSPSADQNPALAGPDWIQIGTEGGFLPEPVVVDGQQVTTWITDPTRFDVGNVDQHSLLLAPAERADVIVDFSDPKFVGKTLILYNDAPAAFPARVPSYDYYTGAPDMSPNGAAAIVPGYGPNTRTIMQVKIAGTAAPAFNLAALQAAFAHQADGSGVFESGQHPIIVGQDAYDSAYGTNFAASSNCNAPNSTLQTCDGFLRVNDHTIFGFNTLLGQNAKMTMAVQPKALHDEMNSSTFDEFGRMTANIGLEAQPPTPGNQNVVLYPFVNPPTELIDATNLPKADVTYDATTGLPTGELKMTPISDAADGSQIWRITHNGVDTHPIHFHLYDVQVLNRVTWDNIIIPTDPAELGWKDTIRVSPLQDTIVALRPIIPELPFELPNAIRPLNPMMPLGSTAMFNNVDPQGNPTAPIVNRLVNFGWEYTYHCHILSHEEMDMMRPVAVALPPNKPDGFTSSITGTGNGARVNLAWNDNSINETEYVIQRLAWPSIWTDVGVVFSPLGQPNTKGPRTFVVPGTYNPNAAYSFRIVAQNTVGYGAEFPAMTVKSTSDTVTLGTAPLAPTNLTAEFQTGPQIKLTWRDNAINESGFVIERSTDGVTFTQIATAPARNNTGNVAFTDTTVQLATAAPLTYHYQVKAGNVAGDSVYSNTAFATVPVAVPPAAPSSLATTLLTGPQIRLNWTDNAVNETDFVIQRSTNGVDFIQLATVPAFTGTGAMSFTDTTVTTSPADVTYSYKVAARNAGGTIFSVNPASVSVLVPALPAAPSNLFAVNGPNANKKRTVILTWVDNSTNETGFTIQRATNALFTQGITTVTVGANVTTLTQTGLTPNTQYWYRIRANNGTIIVTAWVNATPLPIKTNP